MGVPKAVDYWVDIFGIILTGMAKGIINAEEIEEGPADYVDPETKEEVRATAYRGRASMDGSEVMEWIQKIEGYSDLRELLNDSKFKQLPMYKPSIKLRILFFPDKLYNIEFGKRNIEDSVEASHGYDTKNIKLSKLGGDNIVFVGQEFSFTVYAPKSWIDEGGFNEEQFRKMLRSSTSHELVHAYEGYNRFKGTGDPFMGRETFLNAAVKIMKDDKYPQWKVFLHLIYLHLSFEINARITQLYYEMQNKGVRTQDEFMDTLKKSSIWEEITRLQSFDADKFMESFEYQDTGILGLLTDLGKQIDRKKQGLMPIMSIRGKQEGMRHLIDGWNHTLQVLNSQLTKSGVYKGKLMDVVPKKALEDPRVFFKFFEKRFHKKAETFKKKALRLASLVLDEKNVEKVDK